MSSDMSPEDAARFATGAGEQSASGGSKLGGSLGESPGSSSSSGSGVWDMLMSSEPDVSPKHVSGSFDTSAEWHKHLEAGITKATGSGGTPAIVHFVMGFAMLAIQGMETQTGDGDAPETGGDDALAHMSVGDV